MEVMPFSFVAEIAIPSARQCLSLAAPFLAVAALWWLVRRMDQIIDYLFPHWQWERQLGWLDIRTERRADAVLRGMVYVVYAVLAAALYGIVWAASAMASLDHLRDPVVLRELIVRLSVMLVSLGFWLVYLGLSLIPKLRNQYEAEELEQFRREQKEIELERERNPASRLKLSPQKSRSEWAAPPNRTRPGR